MTSKNKSNDILVWFFLVLGSVSLIFLFPIIQGKFDLSHPLENTKAHVIGLAFATGFWLIAALLIGPVHVLKTGALPTAKWQRYRRHVGITVAVLITAHLIGLWNYFYNFEFNKAIKNGSVEGWVAFSLLHAANFYLILMGLTSNNFSMKLLGKLWKGFHRGIYVLYPIIALAEVFEMYRTNTNIIPMIIIGATGIIIPALQIAARKKIKQNSAV